jgi:hypothetical protein
MFLTFPSSKTGCLLTDAMLDACHCDHFWDVFKFLFTILSYALPSLNFMTLV